MWSSVSPKNGANSSEPRPRIVWSRNSRGAWTCKLMHVFSSCLSNESSAAFSSFASFVVSANIAHWPQLLAHWSTSPSPFFRLPSAEAVSGSKRGPEVRPRDARARHRAGVALLENSMPSISRGARAPWRAPAFRVMRVMARASMRRLPRTLGPPPWIWRQLSRKAARGSVIRQTVGGQAGPRLGQLVLVLARLARLQFLKLLLHPRGRDRRHHKRFRRPGGSTSWNLLSRGRAPPALRVPWSQPRPIASDALLDRPRCSRRSCLLLGA